MFKAPSALQHWKQQRLTAMMLIPLTIWFLISVASLASGDYNSVYQWISSPLTASLLSIFILIAGYHAILGLEVVLEDYIQDPVRHRLLIFIRIILLITSLLCLIAMTKITVGDI